MPSSKQQGKKKKIELLRRKTITFPHICTGAIKSSHQDNLGKKGRGAAGEGEKVLATPSAAPSCVCSKPQNTQGLCKRRDASSCIQIYSYILRISIYIFIYIYVNAGSACAEHSLPCLSFVQAAEGKKQTAGIEKEGKPWRFLQQISESFPQHRNLAAVPPRLP